MANGVLEFDHHVFLQLFQSTIASIETTIVMKHVTTFANDFTSIEDSTTTIDKDQLSDVISIPTPVSKVDKKKL